jgi:hypothetical protein
VRPTRRLFLPAAALALLAIQGVSTPVIAGPIPGQGTWETTLQPRDFGNDGSIDAYYDTVLDLTWLVDANFAQTSGFDTDGFMTFSQANTWAAGLTLFGSSDWRLPTVTPVNDTANFNTNFSNNGSTDFGYAKTNVGWGEDSEMGYMYYVHLGNKGRCPPNDGSPGSCAQQSGWGLSNTGPFENLLADFYWTDEALGSSGAWGFGFRDGSQVNFSQFGFGRAWAVHAGDLIGPPPPPPGTLVTHASYDGVGLPAAPVWARSPEDGNFPGVTVTVIDAPRPSLEIHDQGTAFGTRGRYQASPTAEQLARAQTEGWFLRVLLQVPFAGDALDQSIMTEFGEPAGGKRYLLNWGSNASGDPIVGFFGDARTHTVTGAGTDFVLYELAWSPDTQLATLLVNGEVIFSDYAGFNSALTAARVDFGSGSSATTGRGRFALVEWGTGPLVPPTPQTVPIGALPLLGLGLACFGAAVSRLRRGAST